MIKRGLALLVLLCMALPCAGMAEQTEARRVVYLTFDDGPKKDTPELLETLSDDKPRIIALQPISQKEDATRLCIDTCIARNWRLSMQTHKYLNIA